VTKRMSRAVSGLLMLAFVAGSAAGFAETTPAKPASLGITLTNAYDAFGRQGKGLTQDFGFSCVVRYRGKMILFDSGTDARIFERNTFVSSCASAAAPAPKPQRVFRWTPGRGTDTVASRRTAPGSPGSAAGRWESCGCRIAPGTPSPRRCHVFIFC
jgi:hypothetical protein